MSEITAYAGDLINTEDMTIAENLDRIISAKEAIKEAIVAKGGQVSEGARIDQYPAAIEALPSGDDTLDKILGHTVEEIHSTTPITYGRYIFANQSNLKIADVVLSDIINTDYQYGYMFDKCTSLTQAPALPATTLRNYCYNYMFHGCKSLIEAPALPATTLANNCYQNMFYACQNLTQAPALPATNLVSYCYSRMFFYCQNMTKAPDLPSRNLAGQCYQSMFYNCTSLTQAPALPATNLASGCYEQMFSTCLSLTQAPDLPAKTLYSSCYSQMFSTCLSLQKTGIIAAEGNISNYVQSMFTACSSLKEMTWTATTPPTIPSNIWSNCPSDMVIYVPDEAVDVYKAASVWSSRANYIRGISEEFKSIELLEQDDLVVKSFNENAYRINTKLKLTMNDDTTRDLEWIFDKVECGVNDTDSVVVKQIPVSIFGKTINIEITQTANDIPTIQSVVNDTTYGFEMNDNGFYESKNKGVNSSYAYTTVTFVPQSEIVTFECINDGYSSSNFGIMSKVNQVLSKSTSTDSSTLVEKSFSDLNSKNIIEVPYTGLTIGQTYTITVKYKRTSSSTNTGSNDSFQFKVKGE